MALLRQIQILLLLLLSVKGYSQQITEPAFIHKDEKDPKLSNLYSFITNDVWKAYEDYCFKGSGTVRFEILKNGTVANLEIKGNLPEVLQNHIKRKIYETEKRWSFANQNTEISKCFVFMYYLDFHLTPDCPKSDEKEDRIHDVFSNVFQLFQRRDTMIETPTSYLFMPVYITAIY